MTSSDLHGLMRTLDAARDAMNGRAPASRAVRLAESTLKKGVRPEAVEDRVAILALHRIAGIPLKDISIPADESDPQRKALTTVASAWASWMLRRDPAAVGRIEAVIEAADREIIDLSVLNGMTLKFWAEAVLALILGDVEGARKLYGRAMEYGGQFGAESFPAVEWSYVATFWKGSSSSATL